MKKIYVNIINKKIYSILVFHCMYLLSLCVFVFGPSDVLKRFQSILTIASAIESNWIDQLLLLRWQNDLLKKKTIIKIGDHWPYFSITHFCSNLNKFDYIAYQHIAPKIFSYKYIWEINSYADFAQVLTKRSAFFSILCNIIIYNRHKYAMWGDCWAWVLCTLVLYSALLCLCDSFHPYIYLIGRVCHSSWPYYTHIHSWAHFVWFSSERIY